jgi:hypothetical protein
LAWFSKIKSGFSLTLVFPVASSIVAAFLFTKDQRCTPTQFISAAFSWRRLFFTEPIDAVQGAATLKLFGSFDAPMLIASPLTSLIGFLVVVGGA